MEAQVSDVWTALKCSFHRNDSVSRLEPDVGIPVKIICSA